MTPITDKQITKVKIASDQSKVIIGWTTYEQVETGNGTEEEEGEGDSSIAHEFMVKGKHRPHKDLLDAMKSLRKHALESHEITIDSKELPTWTVNQISIAGDVFLKKSRVAMTLAKTVKRTGKVAEMKLGQITMYPETDDLGRYHDAEKMSKIIEEVIEEAWEYLNGKYAEDDPAQLPLFATQPKLETNFTK